MLLSSAREQLSSVTTVIGIRNTSSFCRPLLWFPVIVVTDIALLCGIVSSHALCVEFWLPYTHLYGSVRNDLAVFVGFIAVLECSVGLWHSNQVSYLD